MLKKLVATACYVFMVVFINVCISTLPVLHLAGQAFSSADVIAGAIYVVRDFAQREIKHYIILLMLVSGLISYQLASPAIAIASISAFAVGELLDWSIFTFSGKPLSQRLIYSSLIASPIDTLVFLAVCGQLNWLGFVVMNVGKFFGVLCLWCCWCWRAHAKLQRQGLQVAA